MENKKDKPQGFDRAKMAKKGHFMCIHDCGKYFRTKHEAKQHQDCPSDQKTDNQIEKMNEAYGWRKKSEEEKALERKEREEENKKFRAFLKGLKFESPLRTWQKRKDSSPAPGDSENPILNGNGATGTKTAAEDSSLHMGDTYYYCSEEKSAFDCDWDYKR